MLTPNTPPSPVRFDDLDIPAPLRPALLDLDFTECTDIQALSLPIILQGKDISAQAQTGTGKTAAFLIGVYNKLLRTNRPQDATQPRGLIVAPTRELAIQIHKDALALSKHTGLTTVVAYGGTDYDKQRRNIASGVDVLIGTPGRLIDYFKQGVFKLNQIQVMVLDEADRMFDLGFISDIRYLMRRIPPLHSRQVMLFSATLSHRVQELAYEHMNNPASVQVESDDITASGVEEVLYHPAGNEKIPLLIGLLNKLTPARCIIFTNTRHAAERVHAYLAGNRFDSGILSGSVRQKKRQSLLKRFSEGELHILIATDVAARGLHIENVSHVFNFDLPQNVEDYVHRIGRTARAGKSGVAISFACEEYAFSLMDIETYIGHSIEVASITDELVASVQPPARKPASSAGKPNNSRRRKRKPSGKRTASNEAKPKPTAN